MKKLITLILGIAFVYSCSTSSDGNVIASTPVTDVDGNIYQTVTIGNQTWTTTNLNVTKYSDGTPIPYIILPTSWRGSQTGAWCFSDNDSTRRAIYGNLYNWYAVMGIYDTASLNNPSLRKSIAPTGWHIPSTEEWNTLIYYLDPNAAGVGPQQNHAGGKMKSIGTEHWVTNIGANNNSGFSGLPGGYRSYFLEYSNWRSSGYWWSITQNPSMPESAFNFQLVFDNDSAFRGSSMKMEGLSVRCIKD